MIGQMQPIGTDLQGRPMLGRIVTFVPGLNLVDSKDLASLRENKTFELNFTTKIPPSLAPEQSPEHVGKPILEVMHIERKDKDGMKLVPIEVDDELPLKGLSEELCKRLIGEVLIGEVLRGWERFEQRPGVRHDISKQLEKIGVMPGNPATAGR